MSQGLATPDQPVDRSLAPSLATGRDFWLLMKPNVMKLVVFSGITGVVLAPVAVHPVLTVVAVLCIAAGSGAAAAINNWYDIDIDRRMARTRLRPTAAGRIEPAEALGFGVTLAIFSVMVMGLALNWIAAALLAGTIAFYVFVYTLWLKRRTPHNIVIGGAAGALPPVVGWAAMTGDVGLLPVLIFAVIFLWTPPHFWALAIYRTKDYAGVGVPMLPVVAGAAVTRRQIVAYTAVLVATSLAPVALGLAGWLYGLAAVGLGGWYAWHVIRLWRDPRESRAMRAFKVSIVYLFGILSALMADYGVQGWWS
jgi:protoheme IX farnesyltransferase